MHRRLPLTLAALWLLLTACSHQQPKSFVNVLTEDDSIAIRLDTSQMVTCHSERLGITFQYPSFLQRQPLPADERFELMIFNDVSLTVRVDSVNDITRSPGQQFMGMGAELIEATDRYSIHTGNEEGFDYYAKVIEEPERLITLTLRYLPSHEYAVRQLREWLASYDPVE